MPSSSLVAPAYSGLDAAMASLSNGPLECDQRAALQLALQLSSFHLQPTEGLPSMYMYNNALRYAGGPPSPNTITAAAAAAALSLKRTQNTTECVAVPTSEHVAEIVGKQGCKIKALRTKTNTYIKTPVRNEEPVFVITGRREDVEIAKAEIVQAADHFTQIRAQRRLHPPPHVPGQVTVTMQVPLRLVGLIVGPKGQTIKKIQQDTATYVITPGRDKDPIFEITGCHEGVERAKELIEDHVLARTGNTLEELLIQQNDPTRQRSSSLDDRIWKDSMDMWKDADRLFGGSPDNLSGGSRKESDFGNFDIGCWNVAPESPTHDSTGSNVVGGGSQFFSPTKPQRSLSLANPIDIGHFDYMNNDHRRATRLNSDPIPAFGSIGASIWNVGSIQNGGGGSLQNGPSWMKNGSENGFNGGSNFGFGNVFNKTSLTSNGDSDSSSPAESVVSQKMKRDCMVCQDQEIVAALVPCGHNAFCMGCARGQQRCPLCYEAVQTAVRIQME
ncbi:hypothetical protein RvY_00465 [Ramazzottius varieornatus]|uniref:RING-type domain-containing protein n=1 Tax=Ramazzottius varieornatus TaxID=947166 RepID=A0A1D1UGI8_RAMVA|nr:hypothetical protein RvY_00465 [Ramazzottius varieornatus]